MPRSRKSKISSSRTHNRSYGWIPDVPDHRDFLYSYPAHVGPLPPKVDLRPQSPQEIYDQGQLGSCTANAIAAAHQFDQMKQGLAQPFMPSRLFIYYDERLMEGTIASDSGRKFATASKRLPAKAFAPNPCGPTTFANSLCVRRKLATRPPLLIAPRSILACRGRWRK